MATPKSAERTEYAYASAMGAAAIGAVILTACCARLPAWPELISFTLAAFLLGSRTLCITDTIGTVSVGFMFVFAALIELGPLGGVIAAVASALGGTLLVPDRTHRLRPLVVMAAVSNIALAAAAAGWAYLRLHEACAEMGLTGGVLPAFIVVGVYYMINSAGVCLMASPRVGQSAVRLWSDSLSWTVLPFYFGAGAVIGVHLVSNALGPIVWVALIPPVLLVHFGLVLRTRARVAAQLAQERASAD